MPIVTHRAALAAALALASPALHAQQSPTDAAGEAARVSVNAALAAAPIRVDGVLDEAAWASATPVTRLTQRDPDEGRPVSEATDIRIVYDAQALYVGARMSDRGTVLAPLGRRDMQNVTSDWLGVMIDSRHDHRNSVGFWVTPAGVRNDAVCTDDGCDLSWNPVWTAEARRDPAGWTVELRIPFSQLRFSGGEEQEWGIQLQRIIARRGEFAYFAFTPKGERGGAAAYGHLRGLRGLRPGQPLEVMPYTVARTERIDPRGNPFRSDAEYGVQAGLDLRYRPASDLVLDATINPDFGQVEADPAEVNLTAFETQLAERRSFFVEGADLFDFGRGALGPGANNRHVFYSRRVGRAPQLGASAAAYDAPRTATILGAAKLTGRAGGWSLGVLDALTQEEHTRWLDGDGGVQTGVAEPLTHFMVARALREVRGGRTWAGGVLTAVNRSLGDSAAAAQLRGSAYVGGVDFGHEFAGRAWRVSGYLAASRVQGTPAAITATQRSSTRYYQRPDASHLRLDPDATSLAGWTGQLQIARQAGKHWTGEAFVSNTSPGYEPNDAGYAVRADIRSFGGRLQYQETRPGPVLRGYRLETALAAHYNNAGGRFGSNLFLGTEWTHASFWRLNFNLGHSFENRDNDRLTRGGPVAVGPAESRVFAELTSDSRRALGFNAAFYAREQGRGGGGERSVWAGVRVQPSPRWNLSVGPGLYQVRNAAQFVGSFADTLAAATYGRRYVFADIDQTTLSIETRLNVAFTPDLSLQVYAQPFLTAADFGDYKEFTTPGEFDFDVYGRDRGTARRVEGGATVVDPDGPAGPAGEFTVGSGWSQRDFNLRSLRGSAVLRWEWRPGSTMFLAWQQQREDRGDSGEFGAGRDASALFGAQPDNVLVLKVSYWFAP